MPPRPLALIAIAVAVAAIAVACGKADPAAGPAASASAATPAPSTSPAPAAPSLQRFKVDPFGAAMFVIKVPPEPLSRDIKGTARTFSGELRIDPHDLSRTRGEIAVDLASIETHAYGDTSIDDEITAAARDFLEVGAKSLKEPIRLARFTIQSIDDLSAKDLSSLSGDARSITLTATGLLEVHGIKQDKRVDLTASFSMNGDAIRAVVIKTRSPVAVGLSAHEIKPRSATGEDLAGKAMAARGAAHADEATVTFELTAAPSPAP